MGSGKVEIGDGGGKRGRGREGRQTRKNFEGRESGIGQEKGED